MLLEGSPGSRGVTSRGLCARSDLASYSRVHLPTPWAGATRMLLTDVHRTLITREELFFLGDVVVLQRHVIPVRDRSRCIQAPLL